MSTNSGNTELPATVLSRLAARDAARLAKVAERAATNRSQQSPAESAHKFWEEFDRRRAQIVGALDALAGSGGDGRDTAGSAAQLNGDLTAMEKTVADSSYFLPPYDLRKADAATKALRQRLTELQPAATPQRRPFGFSKAVKKTSALQAASTAASATNEDTFTAAERHDGSGAQDSDAAANREHHGQHGAAPAAQDVRQPIDLEADRCLRGLEGRQVVLRSNSLDGGDFALTDLTDCSVWLLGRLSALRCIRLTRCRVYGGPVCGAAFVQGAQDCTFVLASHQVRIHAAHGCDFYLRVRSNPIIEDCTRLGFGPCPASMPFSSAQLAAAGLAEDWGLWARVHDFLWLRSTPSPNWHVISEDARLVHATVPAEGC